VIGPTGVGLGNDGTLYVADSLDNQIVAIPNALTRQTTALTGIVVSFNGALNDPLGLTIAPNGHIITSNGGDGNLVETTPGGSQVAVKTVDSVTGAGSLFGLAIVPGGQGVYFVDDGDNTLKILESKTPQDNGDDNGGD
jgi:sugar lactone lactonase YvrE